MTSPIAFALHGGAVPNRSRAYDREIVHMRDLAERAAARLRAGAAALDVVAQTIAELEASGLYVAGRGASPNTAGAYELDAAIMDGPSRAAGAVAALQDFANPILVARAVMEATPHVLLAGEGAAGFARERGFPPIDDPDNFFTRAGGGDTGRHATDALAHGTVGCVARDVEGRLAAGTSTGGVFGKRPGRVGDTPLVGAGVWADDAVAVSCTGQGEYFLRVAAAAQVAMRMRFGGETLAEAAGGALADVGALGGEGGLIAVAADGTVTTPFISAGLKRATLRPDGSVESAVF